MYMIYVYKSQIKDFTNYIVIVIFKDNFKTKIQVTNI